MQGLIGQLQVVHALVLRETRTRFGKNQLGYLWALIEPTLWILTFYGMFKVMGRHAPFGMDYVSFLASGIVTFSMFRETLGRSINAIDANKALLFYPHIRPLDLVFARGALEFTTYFAVFAVILGGNLLVTGHIHLADPLRVLYGFALSWLLGLSMGTVFSALSVFSQSVERIIGPLFRPLFWVSGLFFTANSLPRGVRDGLMYNPVLHCVELVRDGMFANYQARYARPSYVFAFIVTFALAGLLLERIARRRLEVT